jgi:hypothetical protein
MKIRASGPEIQAILQAAAEGDVGALEKALAECSNGDLRSVRCTSGCTALHWAAGTNQVDMCRYLILQRNLPVDVAATRKARGRTPLHYACRNGCLEAAKRLVVELGAAVGSRAKHGVTPFQLAVWRNHLPLARWLVEECGVDPTQTNDFGCGAVHWLGIAPPERADGGEEAGSALLPMAAWLAEQPGISFAARQKQGHTALHKASWMGHLAFARYLREEQGLWDDSQDDAGNFAADLADMANTDRHRVVADYLRDHCSRSRAESCAILGVAVAADQATVRRAYLASARKFHPDRCPGSTDRFDAVRKAYRHLSDDRGRGPQSNPAHSLPLMLKISGGVSHNEKKDDDADDDCFKARLIAVLLEYGSKGLDLSNLKKKWGQVWPSTPFPGPQSPSRRRGTMREWIVQQADDIIEMRIDDKGCYKLHAKNCTQSTVAAAATEH